VCYGLNPIAGRAVHDRFGKPVSTESMTMTLLVEKLLCLSTVRLVLASHTLLSLERMMDAHLSNEAD
jgi:hypothetical protein